MLFTFAFRLCFYLHYVFCLLYIICNITAFGKTTDSFEKEFSFKEINQKKLGVFHDFNYNYFTKLKKK